MQLTAISFLFISEFDRHELLIYEEVARMPPFRRKTLVLIGAQGVGRRSIKNKLIMSDQSQYGTTIPCGSWLWCNLEKSVLWPDFISLDFWVLFCYILVALLSCKVGQGELIGCWAACDFHLTTDHFLLEEQKLSGVKSYLNTDNEANTLYYTWIYGAQGMPVFQSLCI